MNVTFMLVDVFGIREAARRHQQELNDDGMPSPKQNRPTLRVLLEIEAECGDIIDAFHEVYCVAFEMLDNEWLRVGASYLQFNDVLKATKHKLEALLSRRDISCVSDLRRVAGCVY